MKNYNKRIQVCSYIKKVETAGIDFITIYKSDVCIHEEKKGLFKTQEGRLQASRRAYSWMQKGVLLKLSGHVLVVSKTKIVYILIIHGL